MEGSCRCFTSWLQKKGSKFGFWHKRFCSLLLDEKVLVIYRDGGCVSEERRILIDSDTVCDLDIKSKPPRFTVKPKNDRPIILGSNDILLVHEWVSSIRALVMQTTDLSMKSFRVISVIGRGLYGKVSMCQKIDSGEIYAIKSVHKNRLLKAHKVMTVVSERNVLMKVRHPFIIHIYFAFQTPSKVYMGLEYIPGGDMAYHLSQRGPFNADDVRIYTAEIAMALDYIHQQGIIYRDLKPENILLAADGHLKLADFGLVKNMSFSKSTYTFCGTPQYIAPEVILNKKYGPKIDWWSLGVVIYTMLFGKTPWINTNFAQLYEQIVKDPVVFPKNVTKEQMDLISSLLEKDPNKRCGIEYIIGHPFFGDLNFSDIFEKKIGPKFIPVISDSKIPQNFEAEFLSEPIQESIATPLRPDSDAFAGFSFILDQDGNDSSADECVIPTGSYAPSSF